MAVKNWTLTDVAAGIHVSEQTIGPQDVGGPADGYSVIKRTLQGGLSEGVDHIRVDNGTFAFEILPTRGMSVWKGWLGEAEIGWRSPVRGPVHPQYVPLSEPSGLGWLDGFDELFVRCGLESNGAPDFDENGRLLYPLHGRIQNKPAHRVDVSIDGDSGEITVTGVVEEARFHFSKLRMTSTFKTKVGEPGFRVEDRIENLSGSEAGMQMLYHVNFGQPLLDAGSRFVAPVQTVVPRNEHAGQGISTWDSYTGEEAGYEEQVYFLELAADAQGMTQTLLKNAHGTQGISLRFNKQQLPCYTLWKNTTATLDGYVTGLEPGTNFPNPRTYEAEQERVVKLPPGGQITFQIALEVHGDAASVAHAEQQISQIAGDGQVRIYDKPQKGWSFDG